MRDEPQRLVPRHVVAELDLDPVVASDALVRAPSEAVEVASVAGADLFGDVTAAIIPGVCDGYSGPVACTASGGGWRANRSSTKISVPFG